jgi:hypothetical protein
MSDDMASQLQEPVHSYVVVKVEDTFGPVSGLSVPNRRKRVTFRFPDDTESFVEVDLAPGWTEKARELIEQHVAETMELLGLRGEVL